MLAGIAGPVIFNLGWMIAQVWQPDAYDPVAHTISDMYAYGAPNAIFLLSCVTLCGIGTILFAILAVRPTVAGHWTGTMSWLSIALSIFGLGSVTAFVGRVDCQLAAPECTTAKQLSNLGGVLDSALSIVGILAMVLAGLLLAAAMRRRPALARFAGLCRLAGLVILALLIANLLLTGLGWGGLAERGLAIIGAAELVLLAGLIFHQNRVGPTQPGLAA